MDRKLSIGIHISIRTCVLILRWRLPLFPSVFSSILSFFLSLYTTMIIAHSFVCLNFAISCLIVMLVHSLCVCMRAFFTSNHFMKFCSIHLYCYCCRRFVYFVISSLLVFFLAILCSMSSCELKNAMLFIIVIVWWIHQKLYGDSMNFWHKTCFQ